VSYSIGFDGVVTAGLEELLRSVENRVNGFGIHAQTSDTGASLAASGHTTPPCPTGQPCSDSVKGPHLLAIVVVVAIVAGAAAGYVAGKRAARHIMESVKGPHL
jgi:hypothetical protein